MKADTELHAVEYCKTVSNAQDCIYILALAKALDNANSRLLAMTAPQPEDARGDPCCDPHKTLAKMCDQCPDRQPPQPTEGVGEMVFAVRRLLGRDPGALGASEREIFTEAVHHLCAIALSADSRPPMQAEPFAYAYVYNNHVGQQVIRFSHGEEINGSRPVETIPLYRRVEAGEEGK